jgi:uncharacterized protein YegL
MDEPLPIPGPREGLAARPLHFFILADCSGSMKKDGKIEALNQAIREALPHMRKAAEDNPEAPLFVRAIRFSDGAQWHVAIPTPVRDFVWTDLMADGVTNMGAALRLVAEELKIPPFPARALPPVIVLITDGEPTDDFGSALKELMEQPWGKRSVRIAIAIGKDANLEVLQKFMGTLGDELKPLQANNVEQLVQYIKWASTTLVKSVASPATRTEQPAAAVAMDHVHITPPPAQAAPQSSSSTSTSVPDGGIVDPTW